MTNDMSTLGAADIARLSEREALQRLELLTAVSRIIADAVDDVDEAIVDVADACVPDFCDLLAVELLGEGGDVGVAAYRVAAASGLQAPPQWSPLGWSCTPDRKPVLGWSRPDEPAQLREVRERLRADSVIVAPIVAGGVTLGWLVAVNGSHRRGFRPSALRIAVELSSRLGAACQRALFHRETQVLARDQARTVRRLKRLAGAATSLAGAATAEGVLEKGCIEACILQEAEGAVARWWLADGRVISAVAGDVAPEVAEQALTSIANGRPARGNGWVSFPLPCTDPWQHAALAVSVRHPLSSDEELLLSSLASLIPVAFERALGTEAAVVHEARVRAVLEASPVALVKVRPGGAVFNANRAAQELFGWTEEETTWLLPDDITPAVLQLVADVRHGGAIANRPVVSDRFDLSVSGAPMPPIAADDERAVIVAATDLTERRRAERSLLQAQRLEAMGQIAGGVAHDFNNLLTLIVGYGDMLERSVEGKHEKEILAKIDRSAKRAAELTRRMLDFTRRQPDTDAVTDVTDALRGLHDVLKRLGGPEVGVVMDTPGTEVWVRGDPSEIEQIVVNLALNACQAMDGSGVLAVGVDVVVPTEDVARGLGLPGGSYARVRVADTGPGMSGDVRSRCMEPFFTTKARGQGSGLGLSTVYGVAAERGGVLRIDSEPGQGTTVEVWIPVVAEEPPGVPGPAEDVQGQRHTLHGRVLVVEGEDDQRAAALRALAEVGADVVGAARAEEALSGMASAGVFDALVTDIVLPGMSGIELASRLQTIRPDLAVLYTTGHPAPAGDGLALVAGSGLLRKPYRPDELCFQLASLLEAGQGSKR